MLIFTRRLFPVPFLTVPVHYFPTSPSTGHREVTLGFITPEQKVSLLTSDQSSITNSWAGFAAGRCPRTASSPLCPPCAHVLHPDHQHLILLMLPGLHFFTLHRQGPL